MAHLQILWSGISCQDVLNVTSSSPLYADNAEYRRSDSWEAKPPLDRERLARWLEKRSGYLTRQGAVWWHTSGSTGKSLAIAFPRYFHSSYLRRAYAQLFPEACVPQGLHAHLCAPRIAAKEIDLAADDWNSRIQNDDLYLMPPKMLHEWTAEDCRRIQHDLAGGKPQTLRADPFYLAAFLRWALRSGADIPKIPIIISSYSPLTRNLRRVFANTFGAQMWDLFAMSECGPLYFDNGNAVIPWVEGVLYEGTTIGADIGGNEIFVGLVSSLRNPYYPLLRYQSGDLFRRSASSDVNMVNYENCGRIHQLVRLQDGTLVTQRSFDDVLSEMPQIWSFAANIRGNCVSLDLMTAPDAPSDDVVTEAAIRIRAMLRDEYDVSARAKEMNVTQPSGKVSLLSYQ